MKKIIILIPLLISLTCPAQRIKAYMAGGFTASQIEGDELKGFNKWGGFVGVGATANLSANNRWKFGVETDYTTRGVRNMSGKPYKVIIPLRYVDIPATLYYHDPKGGMTFGAGLTYGRLVQKPHDSIAFNETFVPDTAALRNFNTNDLCIHAEIRFQVWKWIYFGLKYQRSLLSINEMTFHGDANEFAKSTSINDLDSWTNRCYNMSIQGRLIFQLGDPNEDYRNRGGHHRRRR